MGKKITEKVTWVGKIDWELNEFHGHEYSTEKGSSYNSYLIRDKKTVLMDTVWKPFDDEFVANLKKEIDLKDIDYIVMNHNENDHSGALPALMREIPDTPIYCTKKGEAILRGLYHQDWNFVNVKTGDTLCIVYDLSYLEMTLNVDELEILSIKEGQTVTITADAISDRTFTGVVTSVSAAGPTTGGTTTYPVTIRIDYTGDLLPGMNATAEIEVSSAENALTIPNGAVVRGNYVLVTKDSPSAVNAVQDMTAPDGYVYVKITPGTSDNDSIEVTGGLQEGDTIAYDADAAEKQNASDSGGHGGGNGGPGGGGPGGGF